MHDCPGCQVPLHGHETFCPVCGLKQLVRPEFRGFTETYEKGFNPLGLIVAIILIGGLLVFAAQGSWIGQLIRRGPEIPAGDSALSAPAAREKLESAILQNLSGQAKTCKFVYKSGEKTVDRNDPQAVELTIEVYLKNPSIRKSIVEPVKALMEPGKINVLVLHDSHSQATITYTLSSSSDRDADSENAGATTTEKSTDTNSQ
jgi:hypothetical protein